MRTTVAMETQTEKFFYFWRGLLSQWAPTPFVIGGVRYSCGEQWMMAEKARLFGDDTTRAKIMASRDPRSMKRLGRMVRGFSEERWLKARREIVKVGAVAKYSQSAEAARLLQSTLGHTLVEASPYDTIWGIGLGAEDPRASSRSTWRGLNLLGEILTEIRIEVYGS